MTDTPAVLVDDRNDAPATPTAAGYRLLGGTWCEVDVPAGPRVAVGTCAAWKVEWSAVRPPRGRKRRRQVVGMMAGLAARGAPSARPRTQRDPSTSQVATITQGQHMEEGYTQLGTVLTDQRPKDGEGDGVIVVGRFKGDPYDGVQLSYDAGRRNLYLTPEGALRLAFLLAAAVERDIDIR